MNLRLPCIPCLVGHAHDISAGVDDADAREAFIREVLACIANMDYNRTPPLAAMDIYALLAKTTGLEDPFAEVKRASNRKALDLLDWARSVVAASGDPLDAALRIALAGNIIDYGRCSADGVDMREVIHTYLAAGFALDQRDVFRRRLDEARSVLYVLDNAGEIVFDRVLIEQIGPSRVTCVVRGGPIINDATMEDAVSTGLVDACRVISSGVAASGTPVEACRDEVRDAFASADLVIAKGQGNFETLFDENREVFHLFMVKCPVIARELGVDERSALAFFNRLRKP